MPGGSARSGENEREPTLRAQSCAGARRLRGGGAGCGHGAGGREHRPEHRQAPAGFRLPERFGGPPATTRAPTRTAHYFFVFARSCFCFSTIAATSASSCFASYTIPSLIVYLIPPTRSAWPVLSFRRSAPVPYSTFMFCSGF